jgi:diadenosine tetraphosphate (Ap4A) HIT family hydrolase
MGYCKTCRLLSIRDSGNAPLWDCIYRTKYWDVVHSYNTSLGGWLVLVVRRHIEAIAELTPDEAVELGALLRKVSKAVQQVTGCEKTYVVQFAEHPEHPHVHFHVIPRMANQPEDRCSTGIFTHLGVAEVERVSEAAMNDISEKVREILLLM